MQTLLDWLQVRGRERLEAIKAQAYKQIGAPDSNAEDGQIRLILFPAFVIERLAELQARCDALEAQIQSMQETRH